MTVGKIHLQAHSDQNVIVTGSRQYGIVLKCNTNACTLRFALTEDECASIIKALQRALVEVTT